MDLRPLLTEGWQRAFFNSFMGELIHGGGQLSVSCGLQVPSGMTLHGTHSSLSMSAEASIESMVSIPLPEVTCKPHDTDNCGQTLKKHQKKAPEKSNNKKATLKAGSIGNVNWIFIIRKKRRDDDE